MVLLLKLCVWFMKLVHRISLEETLLFIFPPDFIISTGVFVESEFVVVNSFDFFFKKLSQVHIVELNICL